MPDALHWPRLFSATAGVVSVLLALGCHSSSSRISLDNSDDGRSIAVRVGDEIDITLQTIGPGEYGTPLLSSGAIRFLGESSAGPANPGGPRQLFRFEGREAGRADLAIPHTGENPFSIAPFRITVDVY
jgi:hypothetical protein